MGIAISFKMIKPAKLQIDQYRLKILNALRAEATVHRKELKKTVTTWKDKPDFESAIGLTGEDATVLTGPSGDSKSSQLWEWVDGGTKPHIIRARRAPTLRFQTGYRAKTKTKKFTSGRSRRFGPFVTPKSVRNPGIKAREWSSTLTKRRKKPFTRRLQIAMRKAAKDSFK